MIVNSTNNESLIIPDMNHKGLDEFSYLVSSRLGESGKTGEITIRWMVYKRGPDIILETLKLAVEMYEKKPLINDGSRERTLGGCFFICYQKARKNMEVPLAWPYGKPSDLQKPIREDLIETS